MLDIVDKVSWRKHSFSFIWGLVLSLFLPLLLLPSSLVSLTHLYLHLHHHPQLTLGQPSDTRGLISQSIRAGFLKESKQISSFTVRALFEFDFFFALLHLGWG